MELSLPCLLSPVDSRVGMFLTGAEGVWKQERPPKLVHSKGNLSPYSILIQSVQGGPCGSAHRGLIVPLCPRFAQQQASIPVPRQRRVRMG